MRPVFKVLCLALFCGMAMIVGSNHAQHWYILAVYWMIFFWITIGCVHIVWRQSRMQDKIVLILIALVCGMVWPEIVWRDVNDDLFQFLMTMVICLLTAFFIGILIKFQVDRPEQLSGLDSNQVVWLELRTADGTVYRATGEDARQIWGFYTDAVKMEAIRGNLYQGLRLRAV